jgi:FMN phosphatase YigB (HAD superfamily)/sugar phosphate isomerase/epimerase
MSEHIDAILFDMGGTLRRATAREFSEKVNLCRQILELTSWKADPVDFARLLDTRANAYRKWSRQKLAELNEIGFWTQWMLPELAAEKVSALAVDLNQIWRNADRIYQVLPDAKETILGLFRAGYRLGLVSNTTSSVEAPNLLDELSVSGCFEAVVLSCQVGIRKPRPEILLEATRCMGIQPERCAYIGNLPDRDVAAARSAGFGFTVILRDPQKPVLSSADPALIPDHFIDNLKDLLAIFPARQGKKKPALDGPVYDASLSTMWGIKKFAEFSDFLIASRRLGFAKVELNHQVSPSMLSGINMNGFRFSSVHEPCPAVISAETLKKQDLLISSPDEARRCEGVNSIKRSIDLAHELGAGTVVVHCGQIQADSSDENELRSLFERGQAGSQEYGEKKERFAERRASLVGPYMDAVKKSLAELLNYAGKLNIHLGIENRYHIFDLPSPDEMGEILALAGPDRLGFLYDVGHARALDRLGFYPNEHWLQRFAGRISGVHIHDVIGIMDHRAPGLGEVDFRMVAVYLPRDAFRTLEVMSFNTPEQIKTGLKTLVDTGCVNLI